MVAKKSGVVPGSTCAGEGIRVTVRRRRCDDSSGDFAGCFFSDEEFLVIVTVKNSCGVCTPLRKNLGTSDACVEDPRMSSFKKHKLIIRLPA